MIRSFDERSHNYLGYALLLKGEIDLHVGESTNRAGQVNSERLLSVGIGKAAHQKYQFCAGDEVSGECEPVGDARIEPVDFYKASRLKKLL